MRKKKRGKERLSRRKGRKKKKKKEMKEMRGRRKTKGRGKERLKAPGVVTLSSGGGGERAGGRSIPIKEFPLPGLEGHEIPRLTASRGLRTVDRQVGPRKRKEEAWFVLWIFAFLLSAPFLLFFLPFHPYPHFGLLHFCLNISPTV